MLTIYIPIYLVLLSLIATTPFTEELRKYSFRFVLFVFFLASFLSVLRDPMASNDAENYSNMFSFIKSIGSILEIYHGNYFFSLLMYIAKILQLDYPTFEICLTILCLLIVLVATLIFFDDKRVVLLAFIFLSISSTFILLFTNTIRQGLSLSLLFLTLSLSYRQKKYAYLYFLLSCLSHWSAIVYLPLVVMLVSYQRLLKKINLKHVFLCVVLSPLIGYLIFNIIPIGLDAFAKLDTLKSRDYNNKVVFFKCLLLIMPLAATFFFRNGPNSLKRLDTVLVLIYSYSLMLSFSALSSSLLLSSRYLYYCSGFAALYISYFFVSIKSFILAKVYVVFFSVLLYGLFVFSYSSTINQLGLIKGIISF